MNCIVPVTQQCPGLLTGNRHRNSRSTQFQVIQKPGFSRSTQIQTLNSRFRFGATDIWSQSRSHRFGSDSKPGVDLTGCQPCMYELVETCLEGWEIEYKSEDEKTQFNDRCKDEDDGWYDELSWAINGETTSCVTSQTLKVSSHSVRARKKAERWDEFIVCMTTRAAMFTQTTAALDQPLSTSVLQGQPSRMTNQAEPEAPYLG